MALSPKERERIIEEERLRFETKQALWAEQCARRPRHRRWLWLLAIAAVGYALWCHLACGGPYRACRYDGMMGRHCPYHGETTDPGAGQPIPKQP
jgi:hypothetical protein